ncbi:hypothetical protein MKX03_020998, partial [Papaver bracteatum]
TVKNCEVLKRIEDLNQSLFLELKENFYSLDICCQGTRSQACVFEKKRKLGLFRNQICEKRR